MDVRHTASGEWTLAAGAAVAPGVWLAAWALLLSRNTNVSTVAFGFQDPDADAPRRVQIEVDEELPADRYLRSVAEQLRAQPLEPEAPPFGSVVFVSEDDVPSVRGTGAPSASVLARLSDHLKRLAAELPCTTEAVRSIRHLSDSEYDQVVRQWNPVPTPYPQTTIQALFERQAAERPDATALVFGARRVGYAELNEQANRLANHLIKGGVRPGQGVAIYLERGVTQIVCILATLKAGAAYIPLDVEFPAERIAQMLEDAAPPVVLTHSAVSGRLPSKFDVLIVELDRIDAELECLPASNPVVACDIDSLAYVMFTSGSTGRPKGVEVVHRGIVRLLIGTDYVPFGPDTAMLHMSAASFDASTLEIWGPLLHGGTCVLSPSRVPTLEEIGRLIAANGVNVLWMTASLFNLVIDAAPHILRPVAYLLTGGEALSPRHVEKALRELPRVRLVNGYGPTENTTFSTTYAFDRATFDPAKPIPIGRAIANSTCYILDRFQRPVAPGVPGELYVGGDGVARGYAGQPDLTDERFLPDPFGDRPGARMYKTGDNVRWNEEGLVEFIGRSDHQIKLRGFRIELREIDLALGAFPGVEQAVTVAYDDEGRGKWLAAFVKVADPDRFPLDELKTFAYRKLPDYMVPAAFVAMKEWRYTSSGKLDRAALPKPQLADWSGAEFHPPETPTQEVLADCWKELLGIDRIGIDDDFFELGGDSLCSVRLFHEISLRFGSELPLATLTRHPTIRGLAEAINAAGAQRKGFRCLQTIQPGEAGVVPLFLVHGGQGNVLVFRNLVERLGPRQPVHAFQWSGWDGRRGDAAIPQMARTYHDELVRFCSEGPVCVGGYCVGALVAIELVRLLKAEGREVVAPLLVWDSPNMESIHYRRDEPWDSADTIATFNRMKEKLAAIRIKTTGDYAAPDSDYRPPSGKAALVRRIPGLLPLLRATKAARHYLRTVPARARIVAALAIGRPVPMELRANHCLWTMVKAAKRHRSAKHRGDMLYFRSDCVVGRYFGVSGWWDDPLLGFSELCEGRFEAHAVGGGHTDVLDIPEAGDIVRRTLEATERM